MVRHALLKLISVSVILIVITYLALFISLIFAQI